MGESGTLLVDAPALRFGQVADASGLSVKTVRFCCDEGLIGAVSRTQGGYRLFHPAVLDELALIRSMRAELSGLLGSWKDCGGVKPS